MAPVAAVGPDLVTVSEEEQLAYAVCVSVADSGEPADDEEDAAMDVEDADDYARAMDDPAYLQSVLESLPGVDPGAEAEAGAGGEEDGQKDEKKEEKEKK